MSIDPINQNSNYVSPYNYYRTRSDQSYYSSQHLPIPEDAVPASDQLSSSPFNAHTNELFQTHEFGTTDIDGDYLANTLIISDMPRRTSNYHDCLSEPDPSTNLPSQLRELITKIDTLSKPLTQIQKLSLSQHLTRLSYSLQTSCLCPELTDMVLRSPSPSASPVPNSSVPSTPNLPPGPPPTIGSDWMGPGYTPADHQRPNHISLMKTTISPEAGNSPCIQYDNRHPPTEVLYENTSGSTPTAGQAPPLPPRDVNSYYNTYHNMPERYGKNDKNVEY